MNNGLLGLPSSQAKFSLRGWASERRTVAVSTAYEHPHPMGRTPVAFTPVLRCVVAQGGYLPGDEIYGNKFNNSAASFGMGIGFDDRKAVISFGGFVCFRYAHKTTGAYQSPTLANWKVGINAVAPIPGDLQGTPYSGASLTYFRTGATLGLPATQRFPSFGKRPVFMQVMAECIMSDGTYRPGDVVPVFTSDTATGTQVTSCWYDTQGLGLSSTGAAWVVPVGGGAPVAMTVANWMFYLQGLA